MEFDDELIYFGIKYITLDESIENSENEIIKILEGIVSDTNYMVDKYKEEIERLEDRVEYLEDLLYDNGIEFEE